MIVVKVQFAAAFWQLTNILICVIIRILQRNGLMSKYCGYNIPRIVSIFSFMLDIWYLYKCGSLILPKLNTSSNIVLSKFVNDRTRKIVRNQLELNYCYRTWSYHTTHRPRGIFFTVFIHIRFRHYSILESNQCVQLCRVRESIYTTPVKYKQEVFNREAPIFFIKT